MRGTGIGLGALDHIFDLHFKNFRGLKHRKILKRQTKILTHLTHWLDWIFWIGFVGLAGMDALDHIFDLHFKNFRGSKHRKILKRQTQILTHLTHWLDWIGWIWLVGLDWLDFQPRMSNRPPSQEKKWEVIHDSNAQNTEKSEKCKLKYAARARLPRGNRASGPEPNAFLTKICCAGAATARSTTKLGQNKNFRGSKHRKILKMQTKICCACAVIFTSFWCHSGAHLGAPFANFGHLVQ